MSAISALGRLRQEDCSELEANLAYIARSLLKNTNTKEKREGNERRKDGKMREGGRKREREKGRNERKSQ